MPSRSVPLPDAINSKSNGGTTKQIGAASIMSTRPGWDQAETGLRPGRDQAGVVTRPGSQLRQSPSQGGGLFFLAQLSFLVLIELLLLPHAACCSTRDTHPMQHMDRWTDTHATHCALPQGNRYTNCNHKLPHRSRIISVSLVARESPPNCFHGCSHPTSTAAPHCCSHSWLYLRLPTPICSYSSSSYSNLLLSPPAPIS